MMTDDTELLRRYSKERDEGAFHELVERHFGLVYSTALRLVGGDIHLAEDVSQTVFADLARKSSLVLAQLPAQGEVLDGWLYTGTRFAAAKAVRAEQCRRGYEQEAQQMNEILNGQSMDSEPIWNQLRPVLDDAMGKLSVADRNALLLRFFKDKTLREVGKQLGLSEDAARMRVARALDRLRELLVQQGIKTTTAALAVAVSSNAIGAVPSGLVATIASASLAGAATATTSTTLTILKLMTITKLKIGAVSALIVAAITVPIIQQSRLRQLAAENSQLLRQEQEQIVQLRQENQRLARLKDLPPPTFLELMRLRGEVGLLRSQLRQQTAQRVTNTPPASSSASAPGTVEPLRGEVTARVGSGQTLVTGGWTTEPGKHAFLFVTPVVDPRPNQPGRVMFRSEILEMTDDVLNQSGLEDCTTEARKSSLAGLYTMDQARAFREAMQGLEGVKSESQVHAAFEGGPTKYRLGFPSSTNAPSQRGGPLVELFPRITPGGDSVDLTIRSELPSP